MSLIRRKQQLTPITCSEAGRKYFGKSGKTLKRYGEAGHFKVFKTGEGPTSPWMCYLQEVLAYRDRRMTAGGNI